MSIGQYDIDSVRHDIDMLRTELMAEMEVLSDEIDLLRARIKELEDA